ncbi:unnamed protein product, partial [Ilex paraguariensis]
REFRATNGISKMLHARVEFTTVEANDLSNDAKNPNLERRRANGGIWPKERDQREGLDSYWLDLISIKG